MILYVRNACSLVRTRLGRVQTDVPINYLLFNRPNFGVFNSVHTIGETVRTSRTATGAIEAPAPGPGIGASVDDVRVTRTSQGRHDRHRAIRKSRRNARVSVPAILSSANTPTGQLRRCRGCPSTTRASRR